MHIAALVFIDIAVIMIVARVFGRAARAVGQPAVVGEVISEGTIQNLPLNGRNFSQLSLLLPGVITWNPDSFTDPSAVPQTVRPHAGRRHEPAMRRGGRPAGRPHGDTARTSQRPSALRASACCRGSLVGREETPWPPLAAALF